MLPMEVISTSEAQPLGLFPAPRQGLCSGLELTSQVWIHDGLMTGVPRNTGTVLLATDSASGPQPHPPEWDGACQHVGS